MSDIPCSERIRRAYDASAKMLAVRRKDDPPTVVSLRAEDYITLVDAIETAGVALESLDPFKPQRS